MKTNNTISHESRGAIPEISVDANGNSTVFGAMAHRLWNYGRGDYPKAKAANNAHFVLELRETVTGERWVMVAAQSSRAIAEKYCDKSDRVLVSVEGE